MWLYNTTSLNWRHPLRRLIYIRNTVDYSTKRDAQNIWCAHDLESMQQDNLPYFMCICMQLLLIMSQSLSCREYLWVRIKIQFWSFQARYPIYIWLSVCTHLCYSLLGETLSRSQALTKSQADSTQDRFVKCFCWNQQCFILFSKLQELDKIENI